MKQLQHPDVDTGWAFLVAIAAGLCHFLTLGFAMAFSSFYVIFLEVFNESKGLTAWIGSINYGMMCAVGPIASLLITYHGCRRTVFVGGLLSALGLMLSAFSLNVMSLVLTFGLLSGIGYGLTFTGCIIVISEYFSKYRVFTMGLSLAGGGLGNIFFPWLFGPLLRMYNWRWTLALVGALSLHICAASLLMRPIATGKKRLKHSAYDHHSVPEEIDSKMTSKSNSIKTPQKFVSKFFNRLELRLFYDLNFIMVALNIFLFCLAMSVVFTHISSYALELDFSENSRNVVLSCLGFTGLVGRLVLGAFALIPRVKVGILYAASYFMAGLAVITMGFWQSFSGIVVCSCVYGTFSAAYGPLFSEVTYIVCGKERFVIGYGWTMLFMAIGQTLGAPVAGFLFDHTKFYPASFYFAGGSLLLSSFLVLPFAIKHSIKKSISEETTSTVSI